MKRLVLTPAILAFLVVLGGFPVVFASHSRPFSGSFSGSFTVTSPTTATVTSTGFFEHLGKTTFTSTVTVTSTGSTTCEGAVTATEEQIFTAANGDKLFSSATDLACPTSPTAFTLTATFTITGGTGRFAEVSGSGTIQLSAISTSMTAGTFSGTATGTISY